MTDLDNIINNAAGQWSKYLNQQQENSDFFYQQSSNLEQQQAYEYLDELLQQYENISIEQVFDGTFLENDFGKFFLIEKSIDFQTNWPTKDDAIQQLVNDLKLVYGIKHKREKELKRAGYKTLHDLTTHEKYKHEAEQVLKLIENQDIYSLWQHHYNRYNTKSSIPALNLLGFFEPHETVIFDIETLGLFGRIIFLFGTGVILQNRLIIRQFLALNYEQEAAAIAHFTEFIKPFKALISFNGLTFDQNFVQQRLVYNGLNETIEKPHFDVLRYARRFWADLDLPDFKLKTLEKYILDIEREKDVPGDLVPDFYQKYIETQNIGPLVPIITHNQQDIISTAKLLSLIFK